MRCVQKKFSLRLYRVSLRTPTLKSDQISVTDSVSLSLSTLDAPSPKPNPQLPPFLEPVQKAKGRAERTGFGSAQRSSSRPTRELLKLFGASLQVGGEHLLVSGRSLGRSLTSELLNSIRSLAIVSDHSRRLSPCPDLQLHPC